MDAGPNPNLIVVLSRPEIPENIGFVARCLRGFGIGELRLVGVNPPEPGGRAYWTARSGEALLRQARCFTTLNEALADCSQALGFTRRDRQSSQVLFDLHEVQAYWEHRLSAEHPQVDAMPKPGVKTALVFGCESNGFSNEEVLQVSHLVRIPLADHELSLNLSHAVSIALYALADKGMKSLSRPTDRPVSLAETQAAMDQVLEVLDRNGFLAKGKKDAVRREKVRILWRRIQPTRGELDFLAGGMKALVEKVPSAD